MSSLLIWGFCSLPMKLIEMFKILLFGVGQLMDMVIKIKALKCSTDMKLAGTKPNGVSSLLF